MSESHKKTLKSLNYSDSIIESVNNQPISLEQKILKAERMRKNEEEKQNVVDLEEDVYNTNTNTNTDNINNEVGLNTKGNNLNFTVDSKNLNIHSNKKTVKVTPRPKTDPSNSAQHQKALEESKQRAQKLHQQQLDDQLHLERLRTQFKSAHTDKEAPKPKIILKFLHKQKVYRFECDKKNNMKNLIQHLKIYKIEGKIYRMDYHTQLEYEMEQSVEELGLERIRIFMVK